MPEHPKATFFFALFDFFLQNQICTGSIRDPTAGKPGCLNVVLRFSSFSRNFTDNHRHDLDFVLAARCTQMRMAMPFSESCKVGKDCREMYSFPCSFGRQRLHQQPLSWAGLFCIQTTSCPHMWNLTSESGCKPSTCQIIGRTQRKKNWSLASVGASSFSSF